MERRGEREADRVEIREERERWWRGGRKGRVVRREDGEEG